MPIFSRFFAAPFALSCAAALLCGCFSSNGGPRTSPDSGAPDLGALDGGTDSGGSMDSSMDSTVLAEAGSEAAAEGGGDSPLEGAADATIEGGADAAMEGGPDAAIDSPIADAAAASETGVDASDAGMSPTYYVDPVNGLDTNAGTTTAPFKTIYQATLAVDSYANTNVPGPYTVVLADGQYDATNQSGLMTPSFQNHPVFLQASAPGAATFLGAGGGSTEYIYFQKGGGVKNLTFKNTAYGPEAFAGSFDVVGCSFDGVRGWHVAFIGNTVGTLDTTTGTGFTNIATGGQGWVIYVDNTAQVAWNGGGTTTITGSTTNLYSDFIFMRNAAKLTMSGVTINSYPGYVAVLYDQAGITLNNVTVSGSGWQGGTGGWGTGGAFYVGGSQNGAPSPTVTLNGSSVTGSQGSAFAYQTTTNTGTMTLNATNSHVDASTYGGLWVYGNTNASLSVVVNATGSTFDNNGFFGISALRAAVSFTGTGNSVSGNGAAAAAAGFTPGGIVLSDAASTSSIVLRNVAMSGNTGNYVSLAGAATSTLDLGTAASAGGNTFSGVGASSSAVNLQALIAGTAVGNTWMPSIQGADASGHFPAGTTLAGPQAGQNVTEPANASLLLAP